MEVAMAAPERDSSLRCPTIIMATTLNKCWETVTTTMGMAMKLTFLNSTTNALLSAFFSNSRASSIFTLSPNSALISFSPH
nr:hypothetical protein Itr_chr11CG10830 [Ipomoea trifida]